MSNARQIAVQILQKILNEGLFFSETKEQLQAENNSDISFINMLVLTSLRHRVFICNTLHKFTKQKKTKQQRFVDYALETAIAELLFLNTPDYAVINSYIEIIKQQNNKYIANFANAVLRNISRQKSEILQQNTNIFFTESFKKTALKGYSSKEIQQIERTSSSVTPLDITIKNPQQTIELNQFLKGTILPNNSIRIHNSGKITDLYGYTEGLWWIQDFAASLPVLSLGNIQNQKVLDLCAAPGGKTAQLISRGANVTALDISQNRLNTLQKNLQRLGLQTSATICANAIDFLQNYHGELFDIILLDAPCSASGTIRRHPELIHIKTEKDIDKSTNIQKQLLNLSAKALKKDGILLYTVCSITKKEGEEQINNFLKENSEYKLIPIKQEDILPQAPNTVTKIINKQGCLRTLPHYLEEQGGMDSFFAAKLQKVNK